MSTVLVFLIGAIAVNVIIYGGMSFVYFQDKNRIDPPKGTTALRSLTSTTADDAAATPPPTSPYELDPTEQSAAGRAQSRRQMAGR